MQSLIKTTVVIAILFFNCIHASAQNGPQTVRNEDLKLQFIVPAEWSVSSKEGGYLLAPSDTEGFVLVNMMDVKSQKDLRTAMENGLEQADGSKLMPLGDLNDLGSLGVAGVYEGKLDDADMRGFLMALMPPSGGRAVIAIIIAPTQNFNQSNMDKLKGIVRSVVFL